MKNIRSITPEIIYILCLIIATCYVVKIFNQEFKMNQFYESQFKKEQMQNLKNYIKIEQLEKELQDCKTKKTENK